MIHHKVPKKLVNYIKLLQHLDSQMRAANSFEARRPRNIPCYTAPSTVLPTTILTTSRSEAPSVTPSNSISSYTLMDLSSTHQGPVAPEEKERRRKFGLCGYCGGSGHNQFSCKLFRCYNCGNIGHGAQGCNKPKRQQLQAIQVNAGTEEQSGNVASLN